MYQTRSSNRRPPLAESPQRPRARPILCANSPIQKPSASLTKTQLQNHLWGLEESKLGPEFEPFSGELQALAKMVQDEFGNNGFSTVFAQNSSTISSPLFERGRFYDAYSARRNERLKRKQLETGEDYMTVPEKGGFTVEFGKRKNAKKIESLRKSVPPNFSVGIRENLRSSVRISKENKIPILSRNAERSFLDGDKKKIGPRTGRTIESLRKSVPAHFSVGIRENLRSSVRISKENKKPILSRNTERSFIDGDKKKIGA
ncbi:uncharacterized protein LOC143854672 [Tasmannia lanceolata]|uniref:uncharacterized protein LOC143854672 n=1 Tax=Tasmannia lanceolata TaxID=3420 RepID=UPI0040634EFF